jgi:RnfABCDGE-type electron transport complex B subunit
MTIVWAAIVLFALTLLFAGLLGVAKDKLRVEEDPRIGEVTGVLPAANCGGCGFAGCSDFAKAVVEQRAAPTGCPVGGQTVAEKIAAILGVEVVKTYPYRPVLHCGAHAHEKRGRVPYAGVQRCSEAHLVGVTQACTYGCLEFGDCQAACNFGAIHMEEGLPRINYVKCTGCGSCVAACPRKVLEQIPFKQSKMLVVVCANKEPAKHVKEVCTVGCVGCRMCAKLFAELFDVKDNLAYLDYEKYTGEEDLTGLFKKCPAEVLVYFGEPKPQYAKELVAAEAVAV